MKEQDVSIRLFGGFEVHRNGDLVTNFGYDKVRALLAYLLLEPANPHGRDVLAGLFWPEEPESDARQSLRQALFRLRSALKDDARSPPLLLATRTAIQRNPEATVETDVAAFEQYLEAATNSASNEIDSLVQATALYRGELLHGVSLAGTPAFEDWLRRKREHYHQQVVDLLGRIIRQYQQLNDYEPACHYARRLVSLAPWREDAHRQLMLLLARTGRRSAALKQYEVCCRQIRKELDTEPAPATKRVHRRIQEMAFARFELPPQPTPFVGREQELSTLIAYLSDPKCRLITLTGLGGMGKSRLALQAGRRAARQRAHMFLHGVAFVPLVGVDTHEHMTAAIAQALDFTFSAREDPQMQLLTYLQEKELLLILDSFEHLVNDDSLALLSKMVASAPDVTLLVTSRVRLHLPSEHLMPVGGLSVPDVEAASRVLAEPGVEQSGAPHLFMASMQRIQPDVTPTEEDVRDIIRICQMLAGMPLAIELAAAWTDMLSLTDIAARIEQSLDVLRRDRPGSPARHRSVRAVFDGSWRRLGSNEQRVLAELSLFRGGFTRQAAESVTGVTLPLLSRLVGHSLVQYDRARDRYDVHELLRQYSTEKLGERAAESDANVVADVRSRHCDYYCARMQALEADLWSTREDAALKEIDANFENIRSAWYWAIQQRMVHQLNQAATMLHQYLSRRGRYDEGVAAFQAAIGTVRTHSSRDATHVLAKLLAFRGDLLHQRGDVEQARRNLQESLECLERPMLAQQDTRAERAFVLWCLALLTREAEEAEPLLEESLALYRAIGDEPQVATVLAGLGLLRKVVGDLETAEALFEESLAIRRTLEKPGIVATTSHYLATLRMRQGRLDEGIRLSRDGVALAREIGEQSEVARGLYYLSQGHMYIGQFERAVDALLGSISLYRQRGQHSQLARVTAFLAFMYLHLGQYEDVQRVGERALGLARKDQSAPYRGNALIALGGAALATGARTRAVELLRRAIEAYQTGWRADWRARRSVMQAYTAGALCHLDEVAEAKAEITVALRVAFGVRSLAALMSTVPMLALLLAKDGQIEAAVELYALAETQPHVANSHWFTDVVGAEIEAAARALPADAVTAAQERGRASTLLVTEDIEARITVLCAGNCHTYHASPSHR